MQSSLYFALGALVSFLYVMAVVVIIVACRTQGKPASPGANPDEALPPLAELRDRASVILAEVGTELEQLHLDLQDYQAVSWNRAEDSEERYSRLVNDILLLIDHLENTLNGGGKAEEISWVYEKTNDIMNHAGIERIRPNRGDRFNGLYHKYGAGRPDKLPKGTVLEVTRTGYHGKTVTGERRLFRPAEVIVSSGPPENKGTP
jgi:molecular chaperone GrpE (heat shock protein)